MIKEKPISETTEDFNEKVDGKTIHEMRVQEITSAAVRYTDPPSILPKLWIEQSIAEEERIKKLIFQGQGEGGQEKREGGKMTDLGKGGSVEGEEALLGDPGELRRRPLGPRRRLEEERHWRCGSFATKQMKGIWKADG